MLVSKIVKNNVNQEWTVKRLSRLQETNYHAKELQTHDDTENT